MSVQTGKDERHPCPKTYKLLKTRNHWWVKWVFPITGLLALIWFLVRVVPKPRRATYPCQRVAMPLAGSFVVWLAGMIGSAFAYRKAKELFRRSHLAKALVCFVIAAIAAIVAIINMPETLVIAAPNPNAPIGIAKGIHPGRVVWTYDPDATDWGGTNVDGNDIGYGYWWQSNHTNQAAVDSMMSRSIRMLAGEATEAAAWDAIFRHFNENKGKGNVGYQPGEKITVKVNMVQTNRRFGNIDPNCNQRVWLGRVGTSPQMIVALLRQLVYMVGVEQSDITVGDTSAYFPNHYWDYCHTEFPDVHYLACTSDWGRRGAVSSQGQGCEAPVYWSTPDAAGRTQDYLPFSYAEAAYLINLACLKSHWSAGVTLCAKNHYGSFIRLPDTGGYYNFHPSLPRTVPAMGQYRVLVDMMGHPHLGAKTVLYLIDGLYAGSGWEGRPYKWNMEPFNGDWPSSLFVSQDPVAIDSVAFDFLWTEWNNYPRIPGGDDHLHEAAQADNPPSRTFYDPNHPGNITRLASLGVHEHWNNPTDKQYSRNFGTGDGIELVSLLIAGDFYKLKLFTEQWLQRILYYQPDGPVVIEAERYFGNRQGSGSAQGISWVDQTGSGAAGAGYMQALPDNGLNIDANIETDPPHLSYQVDFNTPGTYYLWLKGMAEDSASGSVHYGFDGVSISSEFANSPQLVQSSAFTWLSQCGDSSRPTITVPSAGLHTVDIWMREDGGKLDRLLLTTDIAYDPNTFVSGEPPESAHQPTDLTADLNNDGEVNLLDFALFTRDWPRP